MKSNKIKFFYSVSNLQSNNMSECCIHNVVLCRQCICSINYRFEKLLGKTFNEKIKHFFLYSGREGVESGSIGI